MALVSDNQLLISSIKDNIPKNIDLDFWSIEQFLSQNSLKADLLVTDQTVSNFNLFSIKTLVILGKKNSSYDALALNLPFKLETLINIITQENSCKKLFCLINNQYLYNEKKLQLSYENELIKFTTKEYEIFNALIHSPNYRVNLQELQNFVWNYHLESNSTTMLVHLHKLKHKLPREMLIISQDQCSLNIINLA